MRCGVHQPRRWGQPKAAGAKAEGLDAGTGAVERPHVIPEIGTEAGGQLTYDNKHLPEDRKQAVQKLKVFFDKLRKARKARGQPLMYIYVTEGCCPGGRVHHHVVLNSTGEDLEELRKLWRYGDNVEVRRLTFDQDHTYEDLASYLTKEPREWGCPKVGERTWTPSNNLAKPDPETETVPDYVTLIAPPGAVVLSNEGPVRNGYGEFTWIKYLLHREPGGRKKAKRRRKKK